MNPETAAASLLFQYKVLKHDLDELLEKIRANQVDLDYYQQLSILRDGIKAISKRSAKVIELIEKQS